MKRARGGLLFAVVASLALAVSASAAAGQTTHFRFNGPFAEAEWFAASNTSFTDTYINISHPKTGPELFVDRFTANATGETDTTVDVTRGFSSTIDATKLTAAGVSGSGLPATTCTFDFNFNLVGCHHTTITVTAHWTGEGPIARISFNQHFKVDGFSENDHFNGTDRNATVTATVGGHTLAGNTLEFADLGRTNAGSTVICIGTTS
jgi:hypothetical protein